MVEKIIKEQREFWNDYDFPFFLVTLRPSLSETSQWGTGLYNTFELVWIKRKFEKDLFAHLISHEHFHTWNNHKIPYDGPKYYWISEGFTDYYAALFLLRAGIISIEKYIKTYNDIISKYYRSPIRNESIESIVGKRHSKEIGFIKIPYWKGTIIAHNWNCQIKESTSGKASLDNIMFDLLRESIKTKKSTTEEKINRIIKKYIGRDVYEDIKKYVDKGQTVPLDKNALGPCCKIKKIKLKELHVGFDGPKSIKSKIIQGVEIGGPAHEAGLRDGQVILEEHTSIPPQVDELITMKLKEKDGKIKTVKYYPVGKKEYEVPQYILDKDFYEKNKKVCLEWFGIN